jgi:hypothetical protein
VPMMSTHQSTASSPRKAPVVAGRVVVSCDIATYRHYAVRIGEAAD